MRSTASKSKALAGLFGCLLISTMSPATAMEWTRSLDITNDIVTFRASGPVVYDDAERLLALVAKTRGASDKPSIAGAFLEHGKRPVIALDSGGGSVDGGLRLGYLVRALQFDTVVPARAECYSACTMIFLGGVQRTILGKFGIHAMSVESDPKSPRSYSDAAIAKLLDNLQSRSSIFISYTREMLGSSDVADAALLFGSEGIKLVTDKELRDWRVITVAARPSQRFQSDEMSSIDCNANADLPKVKNLVCNDLTISRDDIRIANALRMLRHRVDAKALDAEQDRWKSYRDRCEKRLARLGSNAEIIRETPDSDFAGKAVEACVREAFQLRVRELEALAEYYGIGENKVAAQGWRKSTK